MRRRGPRIALAGALCLSGVLTGVVAGGGAARAASGPPSWVAHLPLHVAPYRSGPAARPPGHGGGGGGGSVTNPNPQGYIPCDLSAAYYLGGVTGNGSGQTIAIIDAYAQPNIGSDVNTFDQTLSVSPTGTFSVHRMANHIRSDQGWGLEESLDVEWAQSIAPGANIVLVEAASSSFSDLFSAIDYAVSVLKAQVVSMSWGANEFNGESLYDSYFAPGGGTLFFAAAGDSGSGALWPAASPNVVSVGGTTLGAGAVAGDTTASHTTCPSSGGGATVTNQTAWSGSGGGLSPYEPEPAYQNPTISAFTSSQRGVPDVAWDADPNSGVAVYDSYGYSGQTGWFQVGGTSVGAPSWAAVAAIADQDRNTLSPLDIASDLSSSPTYTAYNTSTSSFTDVTTGTNGSCGKDCTAGSGYDLITGVGTPVGTALLTTSSGSGTLDNS